MKITIAILCQAKAEKRKFVAVSCYDYTSAKLVAAAGVEVLFIGDSAAQLMLGFDSTLPATMDFMAAITSAVKKAAPDKLIVADLPYESFQAGTERIIKDSQRFVKECNADIVKIEANDIQIEIIKAIVDVGIAVMPHLGIRPQTLQYKARGTTADDAAELIKLADEMCRAGAKMLLLEGTAREVAKIITQRLPIPVISCGSGPDCDGQVLVLPDILNLDDGHKPKFSKSFADIGKAYIEAITLYAEQVRQGSFPDDAHCYHIKAGEYEKLEKLTR
ncbi:MAG: 3-methyl-2-oxobutanoate hydroxymethyltransferase [Sedimentisphaerales bacterium]